MIGFEVDIPSCFAFHSRKTSGYEARGQDGCGYWKLSSILLSKSLQFVGSSGGSIF